MKHIHYFSLISLFAVCSCQKANKPETTEEMMQPVNPSPTYTLTPQQKQAYSSHPIKPTYKIGSTALIGDFSVTLKQFSPVDKNTAYLINDNNSTYYELDATVKNMGTERKRFDAGKVTVHYNGKDLDYLTESDERGTYWTYSPLEKGNIMTVVKIPKEVTGIKCWFPQQAADGEDRIGFEIPAAKASINKKTEADEDVPEDDK